MEKSKIQKGKQFETMHTAPYTTKLIRVVDVIEEEGRQMAVFTFLEKRPDGYCNFSLKHKVTVKQLASMVRRELPKDQYLKPVPR